MGAVAFRLRSVLRSRWAATLIVTLIVAVVCGVVIAFAAGAQRTSTAPDRYTSHFGGGFAALVTQPDGGRPRTSEVAALPGVASADPMTFVFGALADAKGEGFDAEVFSGSYRAADVRLVSGRETDPADEHEFVASRSFLDQNHAAVGDSFDLITLTQDQADTNGFSVSDPQGPRLKVVLVGIVDGPAQLDFPTPIVVLSPALLDEPEIGVSETLMAVDLRPGVDLGAFRAQLDTLPDSAGLSLEPGVVISDSVRHAVQAQAGALWLLSAAAAIAAIAVLGQVITRQVRPSQSERERLSAIGFTERQILAEAVGRAAIPITIGSLLGAGLSVVSSGAFPSGFVRIIEPTPGERVEWNVLLGGTALLIAAVTLWAFAALALTRRTTRSLRPSSWVEAVATRTTSATAATGIRLAFTRRARESGSVRGSVMGVLLTIAGLVGAITFGVSLDRLVHQPFRYGSNYDATIGDNGAAALPGGLTDRLDANPDVTSLILYAGSHARIGDITVPVLGMEAIRAGGAPTVLDGRLPASEDEIAFGRVTADDIGARVGDDVTLAGPTRTQVFRVAGIAVVPGLGANDGMGEGGIVTMSGLARVDNASHVTKAAVHLRVPLVQFFASLPEFSDNPPNPPFQPKAIVNVARIRGIPFVLGGVLAALALLTVGHVMLTSMRSRRKDLAILRSLGATGGWITRAVHWQATVLTVLPVAIGVPIGIVAGRLVFIVFADSMGAVDDAAIPFAIIAIGAVATVALANAIAAIPARRSRRIEPARVLQTE